MPLNFKKDIPEARSAGLVLALLVVSLLLLFGYVREGDSGPVHTLQSATSAIFSPLKHASGEVALVEYSTFQKMDDAMASDESIESLKQQNEQLRQTIVQLEEYRQESERLQNLLEYQDMYSLQGVTAPVVSRSGDAWNNMVTIGKGSEEGVRAGYPVVGPTGLIGQVASVNPHTAEVRLLQDAKSGVAVIVQSTRDEGIVKGSLDGLLYLQNLPDNAEVKEGDVVITSGLGGSFYRGLMVGTVVKIEGEKGDPSRKIIVEPNDSVGPLEEVIVVSGMEPKEETPEAKEDESESAEEEPEAEVEEYYYEEYAG